METLILILCMLGGVLIHFVMKIVRFVKKHETLKNFKWLMPLLTAGLSIITNIILILVRADLIGILPFTMFTSVMYGYMGDSIFRNLMKSQKPKLNEPNK